jgi:hypothetical protein
MKKLAFTIAAVAAFSFANAQEIQQPTQTPTKTKATTTTSKKEGAATKKEAVATEGSVGTGATETNPNKSTGATDPKKSGTRMAINEKGLPGDKKSTKSTGTNPK